jgi:hypothetical protein
MVAMESGAELTPWHMMVCWKCGDIRCPLGPYWTSELLSYIQGLLILCTVK